MTGSHPEFKLGILSYYRDSSDNKQVVKDGDNEKDDAELMVEKGRKRKKEKHRNGI